MKVSIITPSFNKTEYVLDAIDSVLDQTFRDFDYWVIENSTDKRTNRLVRGYALVHSNVHFGVISKEYTPEQRAAEYIPAVILNEYLDQLTGEYILYLSDDDVLDPHCLEVAVAYMDSHPEESVCWFSMKSVKGSGSNWTDNGAIFANRILQEGEGVDCVLDGGQVLIRKSALKVLDKPYFQTDWLNASHCDGLFLNRLNEHFAFYPIEQVLLTHRTTEVSTHADK